MTSPAPVCDVTIQTSFTRKQMKHSMYEKSVDLSKQIVWVFFKGWRCLYCACKKAHYVDNINGYLLLLKRYSFFTPQTFAARYDFDEVLLSLPLGANSHQEHCKNEATGFAKP